MKTIFFDIARTTSPAGEESSVSVAVSRGAAIRLYGAIVQLRPDWHSDGINAR